MELVNLDTGMNHVLMTLRPSTKSWVKFLTCSIPRIVLSADGRRVAVVVGQTEVQVWDLSRKRRVATFDLVFAEGEETGPTLLHAIRFAP